MTIITTNDDRRYQTAGVGNTIGAVVAGGVASRAVSNSINAVVNTPAINGPKQTNKGLPVDALRAGIKDAFYNEAKLNTAVGGGAKLLDLVDHQKLPNLGEIVINGLSETQLSQLPESSANLIKSIRANLVLPKSLKNSRIGDIMSVGMARMLEQGRNAIFWPKTNEIAVNIEKLGTAAFHEMGHAVNHNFSKFWKGMQKLRVPCGIAGGLFGTVALFKRKKVEGEEPKGFFDKTTTFIKNNVGKLTLAAFAPIVAEELMATYRGNKMAKKVLSPELFKKVQKTNRFGAMTYIAAGVGAALAAVVGSKVRDAIAKPKEIKVVKG